MTDRTEKSRGTKPLSVTHPYLAAEALGWDPSSVVSGSKQHRKWLCSRGHEWESAVFSRASNGAGCPYCTNRRVWVGFNDLLTQFPHVAREADGWDPAEVMAFTKKKMPWVCPSGHRYEAEVQSRTRHGTSCARCSNSWLVIGDNDFATMRPELASQADGWAPKEVHSNDKVKRPWKCKRGHTWLATPLARNQGRGNCPECFPLEVRAPKPIPASADLVTLFPEISQQADGWNPTGFHPGSHKRRPWRCGLGHTWTAHVFSRTKNGSDCPFCSNQRAWPGFNDLTSRFPEVAVEADGWDPSHVVFGSNAVRKWKCEFDHTWTTRVWHRTRTGTGCPYCANLLVWPGFNDLATTHPELSFEAYEWDPTTVTFGSAKKMEWWCAKGHSWTASVANRVGGSGCLICSGKKVLLGFNDFASLHPEIALEALGWDPATVTAGSNQKKKWKCDTCEHIWTTVVSARTRSGSPSNCPRCSPFGFDARLDGWLYLLEHELWGLLQIGITNLPDQRIGTHGKRGWRVMDVRGPLPGDVTKEWESSILKMLSSIGVKLRPEHVAGRFDGYTEAWIQDDYPVTTLRSLMALVNDDEEGSSQQLDEAGS